MTAASSASTRSPSGCSADPGSSRSTSGLRPASGRPQHRHTESATAFFRQALARTGWQPTQVISDHHQPYVKAVQEVLPQAEHVRTGLHRARGETTKPIERSHVFTRDRLRISRGVKTLPTGQRFFEGFEALHALRRGHTDVAHLVPGHDAARATVHE